MEDPELLSQIPKDKEETTLGKLFNKPLTRRAASHLGLAVAAGMTTKFSNDSLLGMFLDKLAKKSKPEKKDTSNSEAKIIKEPKNEPTSTPTDPDFLLIQSEFIPVVEERKNPIPEINNIPSPPEIPKSIEELSNPELIKKIINLKPEPVDSKGERTLLEYEYVKRAQDLNGIRLGLNLISNRYCRDALVGNLSLIMEKGDNRDFPKKITEDQEKWCQEKGIEPVILNLCLIQEEKAKEAIKKLQAKKLIRNDLPESCDPSELMISAGGLAELILQETSNFTYIGDGAAFDSINPSAFPGDILALEEWSKILSKEVLNPIYPNLKVSTFALPGSSLGNPNINLSGGAIGIQFMPSNALEIHNLLKDIGVLFNPYDPFDSLIGAWVFIARQLDVIDSEGKPAIRSGYQKDNDKKIFYSIAKWNPFKKEIEAIMGADQDYRKKFDKKA